MPFEDLSFDSELLIVSYLPIRSKVVLDEAHKTVGVRLAGRRHSIGPASSMPQRAASMR